MNNFRIVINRSQILMIVLMVLFTLMFSSCVTQIKVSKNLNQYNHYSKEGVWIVAADTSYVIRFETYRKNVLSGPYIEYYKNGICATNGRYRNGKRVGWWIHRSSEGIRIAKDKYRKGEVVRGISYNPVF